MQTKQFKSSEYNVSYNAKKRNSDTDFMEKHRLLSRQWYQRTRHENSEKRTKITQTNLINQVLNEIYPNLQSQHDDIKSVYLDILNAKSSRFSDSFISVYMLAIQSSKPRSVCAVGAFHVLSVHFNMQELSLNEISKIAGVSAASLQYAHDKFIRILNAVKSGTEDEQPEFKALFKKKNQETHTVDVDTKSLKEETSEVGGDDYSSTKTANDDSKYKIKCFIYLEDGSRQIPVMNTTQDIDETTFNLISMMPRKRNNHVLHGPVLDAPEIPRFP